ncbi:hypothetical protein AVEN_106401-1 [Araneus ventricosus]|uniref:Uncharacterized protein n=1 Tax=Araneus ventricosus TaxID=182803 RepID=A0A4Y2AUM7_ARAVE|nr:hypothetical protein AVEN_106401-1 [Araneus ventricosus]
MRTLLTPSRFILSRSGCAEKCARHRGQGCALHPTPECKRLAEMDATAPSLHFEASPAYYPKFPSPASQIEKPLTCKQFFHVASSKEKVDIKTPSVHKLCPDDFFLPPGLLRNHYLHQRRDLRIIGNDLSLLPSLKEESRSKVIDDRDGNSDSGPHDLCRFHRTNKAIHVC